MLPYVIASPPQARRGNLFDGLLDLGLLDDGTKYEVLVMKSAVGSRQIEAFNVTLSAVEGGLLDLGLLDDGNKYEVRVIK